MFLSFKIQSSKHELHLFDPPVYEIDCFLTDQVMLKSCLLSVSFQIYFESSILFEYLLWLNDLIVLEIVLTCNHKKKYLVKNLKYGGMHALFDTDMATFPTINI